MVWYGMVWYGRFFWCCWLFRYFISSWVLLVIPFCGENEKTKGLDFCVGWSRELLPSFLALLHRHLCPLHLGVISMMLGRRPPPSIELLWPQKKHALKRLLDIDVSSRIWNWKLTLPRYAQSFFRLELKVWTRWYSRLGMALWLMKVSKPRSRYYRMRSRQWSRPLADLIQRLRRGWIMGF